MNVTPRRELGQHFLADDNILHVAGRLADLGPGDVVLEVGAGPGALTAFLAERVAHVHAVELDRSLEAAFRGRVGGKRNVELVLGDALTLPLDELDPAPTKLVANLPYQIATPLVVESLDVSVLVQLTAARTGFHRVSRAVFRPPPNVESALVAFRRTRRWGEEYVHLKRVVQAAFAHRRKTLANALALAGLDVARAAGAGVDVRARAETLAPEEFVRLADALT